MYVHHLALNPHKSLQALPQLLTFSLIMIEIELVPVSASLAHKLRSPSCKSQCSAAGGFPGMKDNCLCKQGEHTLTCWLRVKCSSITKNMTGLYKPKQSPYLINIQIIFLLKAAYVLADLRSRSILHLQKHSRFELRALHFSHTVQNVSRPRKAARSQDSAPVRTFCSPQHVVPGRECRIQLLKNGNK